MGHADRLVDQALARAVVYRTLSLAFQAPTPERLKEIGAHDGFPAARAALNQVSAGAANGGYLEAAAAQLLSIDLVDLDDLAARFARLFGHTARGRVCACESEYGPDNGFHQPQLLADISGYYLAFGLEPPATAEVRLDHIACECEFMDVLNRKEAYLLWTGRSADASETLDVTRRVARAFLRDHLGRFGRAFATRVAAEDRDDFLGAMGIVLLRWIEAECVRVGVDAGPVDLVLRSDTDDETPMACGTAEQLIQIQRRP